MIPTKTGYVDTVEGRVYYETAGQGSPVVLMHAGFLDSEMWNLQWTALSQDHAVIRFDFPGFGKSDRVQEPVSHRKVLYAVLDQLGVRQALLVGCSLGGETALDAALERPELVTGLVLVSTAPGGFELQGEPPRPLIEMVSMLERNNLVEASEMQLRLWVDGPFRRPEQVDPALRQRAAAMNRIALDKGPWRLAVASDPTPLQPPAMPRLGEIRLPVLIVAGALDDPELLRAADALEGRIPGARKVIIPEAAHVPNMEQPEAFNAALLEFLKAV